MSPKGNTANIVIFLPYRAGYCDKSHTLLTPEHSIAFCSYADITMLDSPESKLLKQKKIFVNRLRKSHLTCVLRKRVKGADTRRGHKWATDFADGRPREIGQLFHRCP